MPAGMIDPMEIEALDAMRESTGISGQNFRLPRYSVNPDRMPMRHHNWFNYCLFKLTAYCYETVEAGNEPTIRDFSAKQHDLTGKDTFRRLAAIIANRAGFTVSKRGGIRDFEPRLLTREGTRALRYQWEAQSKTPKRQRARAVGEAVFNRGYKLYDPVREIILDPENLLAEIESKNDV